MRKIFFTGLIIAAAAPAYAADPNGDWLEEDGLAHIRIVDCGSSKWGVVAWEKIPGGIDKQNPDAAKKTRPTLGMPILLNMKKKGSAEEWEGSVYNSQNGKTYDSRIKLLAQDKLEIKGCVLGILCGGQTWTRVADAPVPGVAKGPGGSKSAAPAKAGTSAAPSTTAAKGGPAGAAKTGAVSANPLDDICAIPEIARASTGTSGRAVN